MRQHVVGSIALLALGTLLLLPGRLPAQPPGGFPPPPVLSAIDANKDGEISPQELKNASEALKTLDKNKDGQLAGDELMPAFGGRGPGGRGGPGGGPGGRGFNFGGFNPFGGGGSVEPKSPEEIEFRDGVAKILDHATYHKLSYRGEEVMIDTFLADLEFVKFTLNNATSEKPQLYFINTKTHRAHMMFGRAVGLPFSRGGGGQMKGVLVYRPMLKSPSGKPGLYTFEFEPFDAYSFEMVNRCRDELIKKMPALQGNIGYFPRGNRASEVCDSEQKLYAAAKLPIYRDEDLINTDLAYLPLNLGKSYGRLRLMKIDERPGSRDVVLYETLPNELPRVAGIITAVRQTPLSHVNLRAVQDKVPNAFVANAAANETIKPLIGKFVSYEVTADGYQIREAAAREVEAHFARRRPKSQQSPSRDLTVKQVRSLDAVKFKDAESVGVKAANLATLRTFGFPEGTIPDGSAVPFYFYDEFMKQNGFYDYAKQLVRNPEFRKSQATQEAELKKFRNLIKKGRMPEWMMAALGDLQKSYPEGASIRCRSSTNNEDLPGFSGAGLYDSYTHHPKEGHLSKSIKQVYASLWNFRAFEEREFYRVDHFSTAMGVLAHPNYKGELANGVAVTDDILYQTAGNYYLNTQVGEDLVTNPNEESIPEEGLLDWWKSSEYQLMRTSNRAKAGQQLLDAKHLEQLRGHLGKIHARFARLYGKTKDSEDFAMEIEFKITKEGKLAIKQARPWVYAQPNQTSGGSQELQP